MSNYYLHAILLKDCPYSNKAHDLIKKYKIKNTINIVDESNKEKFKMENYFTYPQIFLKKDESNSSLFLGGYSDLNNFIDTFKNKYNDIDVRVIQDKYKWSKKAVLRLIELIVK